MSNHYYDPTANAAIGAIDRELKKAERLAKTIAARRKSGSLSPADVALAHKLFRGIYKPLLAKALFE